MIDKSIAWRNGAVVLLRVLIPFATVALLFAGIVHLVGVRIPLGSAVFAEPTILPAGIVEGLAGVLFAVATYAVFARRGWAWSAALAAHLFAIAGFLVGIIATRSGTTPFNHVYHYVMMAVFVLGLLLLMAPGARTALGDDALPRLEATPPPTGSRL
jgi:hypothetical protein